MEVAACYPDDRKHPGCRWIENPDHSVEPGQESVTAAAMRQGEEPAIEPFGGDGGRVFGRWGARSSGVRAGPRHKGSRKSGHPTESGRASESWSSRVF
ncbi:hypothetical protein NL676_034231 [Syzygium grande]|nr:hypothetical protein NL676_034231 [Syzygium grande]